MSCSWPDSWREGANHLRRATPSTPFGPPYTEKIYIIDVDGSNLTKLIDLKGGRGQPAWSPVPAAGEHWIVYSDQADGTPDGYHDLFAYGVDTQRIIRLTWFPDITVDEPAWSADGAFLSARHQWDLHPWHVYGFIFAVEEVTTGEETVPALGSWLDTDHWNYNHWYYMDDDPFNDDNCGFGSTDWSNGQYSYPYMMLGMCGSRTAFRLDLDRGLPLCGVPGSGRNRRDPAGPCGPSIFGSRFHQICCRSGLHGRFSPDNSQFVFQGDHS